MNSKNEELYVGYIDKAPVGIGRFIKKFTLLLIVAAPILSFILVFAQNQFYPVVFEFLNYRTFEGTVIEKPFPMLLVQRPGENGNATDASQYFLVAEGKIGAQEMTAGLSGKRVSLEGALIYRDNQTIIEVKPNTLKEVSSAGAASSTGESMQLGTVTLVGEIVDSKCFFGVMNPGNLKVHRSCAVRCISGGIPPVFAVKSTQGETHYFLLTGTQGEAINDKILDRIAEPLEISGELVSNGDKFVFKAAPENYRRLD